MGNTVSTKLSSAIEKMERKQNSVGLLWSVLISIHTGLRWTELKETKENGKHIILLGKNDKAKEKVFRYFLPLEDKDYLNEGLIKNSNKYFGLFKLTVTSIDGLSGNGKEDMEKLQKTTLLICHPSTPTHFTFDWSTHFKTLKDKSKGSYIVLTECNCPCKYYSKCKIPDDIPQECKGNTILFRTDGKEIGYRMFFMKLPTELIFEISKQIPTTGRLIVDQAPLVFLTTVRFVRQVREFILVVNKLRRNGSAFSIKHSYMN